MGKKSVIRMSDENYVKWVRFAAAFDDHEEALMTLLDEQRENAEASRNRKF